MSAKTIDGRFFEESFEWSYRMTLTPMWVYAETSAGAITLRVELPATTPPAKAVSMLRSLVISYYGYERERR